MKKRILACLLALVMLIGVLPVMALAEGSNVPDGKARIGTTDYDTVEAAVKAAPERDTTTIILGAGEYTLWNEDEATMASPSRHLGENKNLIFVGQGADKTTYHIGAKDTSHKDGPCDYSLDGRGTEMKETVTFQNMTIDAGKYPNSQTSNAYLHGLAGIDNIVLKDCTFNGIASYWGYETTTFDHVTFNAPGTEESGIPGLDYSLWTYTGKSCTFKNCTFNSAGKTINVYRHGDPGYDVTVNFESCTANTTAHKKQVMKIDDSCMGNSKFILKISGDNKVNGVEPEKGNGVEPNPITCSRLFGFEGSQNSGRTVVYIEGEKVWENGVRVGSHSKDFTTGSYDDGVAEGTANKYTEGYKDNAFKIKSETDWAQQPDGSYKREITRVCKYCGDEETVVETKRDDIDDITAVLLPALQANTDDHYSYLIGYADGTVRPNGKITRAEVATIFFRLLDDDTRAKYWSSENNFSDVSADKWYNNAVSTLSRMGVIGGYADGTFRPDAPISRAEFAKIAVSFTQNNGSAVYNYFTDVKTTDWFAPYVTAAKDAGLIEGYSDGSFKPESKITRAEACAIVNRTLGRKPSKSHMKISDRIDWPDVQTTDWFYEAIMEATNSHTCTMGDRVETWTGKLPQRDWATLETGWANAYTGR